MRKRAKFWSAPFLSGVLIPLRTPGGFKSFTSSALSWPRVTNVPLARSFASHATDIANGEVQDLTDLFTTQFRCCCTKLEKNQVSTGDAKADYYIP